MLNQRSPRAIMAQIIKQIICIGMTLVVILPILLTVFAALKTRGDMVNTSPLLLPPLDRITLENFETVLGNKYLWIGFKNTLIILAVSLIFNVLLGTITASGGQPDLQRAAGHHYSLYHRAVQLPGQKDRGRPVLCRDAGAHLRH